MGAEAEGREGRVGWGPGSPVGEGAGGTQARLSRGLSLSIYGVGVRCAQGAWLRGWISYSIYHYPPRYNKSTVALGLGGKGLSNSTPSPAAVYAWVAVLSWNRAHFSRRKSPSRKHLAESQGLAQLHQGCASVSPLLTWRTQDPWGGEARPGPPPGLLSWAELAAPLHQGP